MVRACGGVPGGPGLLACNIERKGRVARVTMGVVLVAAAVAVLAPPGALDRVALVLPGALLGVGGLFCVFEGLAGWCALRALGVRLPL